MAGVNFELPCVAYTGEEPFAFISYAHRDAELVYPEIQRLDLMGYLIWYDEGIDPGNEWPEEVANALKKATQFIVFVTQNAIGSRNVRNEINYALKLDKPFFAIHLDKTDLPPDMDLQMSSIQAILKWQMNEQTYIRNLERSLPRTFGRLLHDNFQEEESSYDEIVNLIARTMHNDRQSHMKEDLRINWHQQDTVQREKALVQSRFLLSMLHVAGFNISRAVDSDKPYMFSLEDIELLARMDHDRWARERFENNWRFGTIRDNAKKLHNALIPYRIIPEDYKIYDRDAVSHLPELLLKSGFAISSIYEEPDRITIFQFTNK